MRASFYYTYVSAAVAILVVGLCVFPVRLPAQDAVENPELAKLQKTFDDAYAKVEQPITNLNANYVQALQRLFTQETSASRLDSALQIKAEMDGFADGSKFSPEAFAERSLDTENVALSALRRKYLNERERLRNVGRGARDELLSQYQAALLRLENQQTQSGMVEKAFVVRTTREALDTDVRFAEGAGVVGPDRTLICELHFVAKGDIELTLNGSRLTYRNVADERNKYVDGTIRSAMYRVGDIIQIKMRSQAVFRSLIIGLETEDGTISIPFKLEDYHYLGSGSGGGDKLLKPEEILQLTERPAPGDPDYLMADMWLEKSISKTTQNGSEWVKIGPSNDWYFYVVVLRKEMLQEIREAPPEFR